ncbi:MAG TPA: hypothetical protein VFV96_15715 [Verrucomicrobiae bacterium]|nr:hypothetical protein [Verrucomicrobiae bacterium]
MAHHLIVKTERHLRFGTGCLLLLLFLGSGAAARADSATLYATQFEPGEGFSTDFYLAGQGGWMSSGSGGNGVVSNYIENLGQQAYVGYFPPDPGDAALFVWHPVNYYPSNAPKVRFSVEMAVIDSTTNQPNRDQFRWAVYNVAGDPLFSLLFDNADLSIWRGLDNGNFYDTGWGFTNSESYTLEVAMDFAVNRWNAWLNGVQIVTNSQMTTQSAALNFGDADAVWVPADSSQPGDNYLLFDNYAITVDAPVQIDASLQPPLAVGGGQYVLRVKGKENARYAVEASTNLLNWLPLKTNVVTGGYFDYLDAGAAGLKQRFYRARWVP